MSPIETLQQAVRESFRTEKVASHTPLFLLACSGGADSVSLGATLFSLSIPFDIAHVNYKLRGEDSDADQQLVEKLARQWGAGIHSRAVHSEEWQKGESLQAQAREIRYEFFHELLKTEKYQVCLLAHHQGDQAETILMSLIKGNSFSILSPIPPARPGFLRPFLTVGTSTCRSALTDWGTPWREDASNQKDIYLRNKLRNKIIPALEEINPSISDQLVTKSHLYQAQQDLLTDLLREAVQTGLSIHNNVHTFSWQHLPESMVAKHLPTILAFVLSEWDWHGHHVWQGAELATAESGKRRDFEGVLIKGRQLIQWIKPQTNASESWTIESENDLPIAGSCLGRAFSLEAISSPSSYIPPENTHFLNLEKVKFPLVVRMLTSGDSMIPLGMKGTKLLSDVMIDAKFRPAQKELAIALEDQSGIIALSDFRIADQVKCSKVTKSCLKLVIEDAD